MSRLPPASGSEARQAVEDVLRDQAERQERRERGTKPPGDHRPLQLAVIVVGVVLTVWMLVRPPAFIRPPPLAPPPPAKIEAGLRLDMYVARLAIERYRMRTGSLPASLADALEDSTDARDLTFRQLDGSTYRLTGARGGFSVVWESDEPVSELLGNALRALSRKEP